jgi:hypothetical protein
MHEMFDDEEELDRSTSAEIEKSVAEAPGVTSKHSMTTPIRKKVAKGDPGPTRAEISGPTADDLLAQVPAQAPEPEPEPASESRPASRPSSRPIPRPGFSDPRQPPPGLYEEDEEEDTEGNLEAQEDSMDETLSDVPWVIDKELSQESIESLEREVSAERTLDEAEPAGWRFPIPAWMVIVGLIVILAGAIVVIQLANKDGRRSVGKAIDAGVPGSHQTASTGPRETFRPRYSDPPPETAPPEIPVKPPVAPEVKPDAGAPPDTGLPKTAADEIIAANTPPDAKSPATAGKKRKRRKKRKKKVAVAPKRWCRKTLDPGHGKVDVGLTGGWGVVYIDGEKIRYTPLIQHRLTAGTHGIIIKDKNGVLIRKWCIRLRDGQHIKLVHQ